MKTIENKVRWIILVVLVGTCHNFVFAQSQLVSLNYQMGPISGSAEGVGDSKNERLLVVAPFYNTTSTVISNPGVQGQRIYFSNVNLGAKSYLLIQSHLDNGIQRLDNISMEQWNYASAFFNGDALTITLCVAPDESNIHASINSVVIYTGLIPFQAINPGIESICDGTDDRVVSTDNRVGRILSTTAPGSSLSTCTGWQISNGVFLTAGHCVVGGMQVYELNVPMSTSNGGIIFANPNDQYPVAQGSFIFENANEGDDWCIFNVNPNSNTGLLPYQNGANANVINNRFFRCSWELLPGTSGSTTRITGFGKDSLPVGTGGGRNSFNATNQTHVGPFDAKSGSGNSIKIEYTVDTEPGNSGSPVIIEGTNTTIGIHTYGDCPLNGVNGGTSFDAQDLENAINNYLGPGNVYVDVDHPSIFTFGSVMNPYHTVSGAVANASSGDILKIVEGVYIESVIINKTLTLTAPVGLVVISPSPTPLQQVTNRSSKSENENSLVAIHPNPANDFITIKIKNANSKATLRIYNSTMQLVKTLYFENGSENKITVNDFANGIYFIDAHSGDQSYQTKFVVSR